MGRSFENETLAGNAPNKASRAITGIINAPAKEEYTTLKPAPSKRLGWSRPRVGEVSL